MLFRNAMIFLESRGFVYGNFSVVNGRITRVGWEFGENTSGKHMVPMTQDRETVDLGGARVIPGLVDIHIHGNSGCDFSDGDPEGLRKMGRYLAANGITSFAPASMTLPYDRLEAAYRTAAEYAENEPDDAARLAGIHMEGPFFSEKKKGAQNAEYLRLPDAEAFARLNDASGGRIRIADVAPELPGAESYIREVSQKCRVSVAHTDASYEEAAAAFRCGASHVTHLFNAMPPIHHRHPGVIGAAAEREDVTAELICDGHHVHPSIVRMAFRLFPERICLISDALRCCGMPDGQYELGGQQVTLAGGAARLADGTLAGAASNLYTDMVNAIRFGIDPKEAVNAATINPAKALGCGDRIGSIDAGKCADFLICDEDWNLKQVWLRGKAVK